MRMSLIFEKKGVFSGQKIRENLKKGSHLPHTITIFVPLGEIHLKVLFSVL